MQNTLSVLEKENLLRQQAGECHKRKAIEIGTQCQEMAFRNETLSKQCEEVRTNFYNKSLHIPRSSELLKLVFVIS